MSWSVTRRGLLVLGIGLVPALLPALLDGRLWVLWAAGLAASLIALALCSALAARATDIDIDVAAPGQALVGDPFDVRVSAKVARGHAVRLMLRIEHGRRFEQASAASVVASPAGSVTTIAVRPSRRGRERIEGVWMRWCGPFGLTQRTVRRSIVHDIDVVPNVKEVRTAALRFFGSRDPVAGVNAERYIGDGSEFDALREYVPGFDPRSIHWKASARHRRLITREFRAERNHQILLAIDTGRLMGEPIGELTRLDHAISAGLLLAYVSLKMGDRVGVFAFDAKPRIFTTPQSGVATFQRIQRATAALDYGTSETNFTLGLTEAALRVKQRALIVVFTDFVDTVTAELMRENLERLSRRHLVLFVTYRDPDLVELAAVSPATRRDLSRSVIAWDQLRERDIVLKRLERAGIRTIDTAPGAVSAQVLSKYLDIKRREAIA